MIPFNRPPVVGTELNYIQKVIENRKLCGDGEYTAKCSQLLKQRTGTSCACRCTTP